MESKRGLTSRFGKIETSDFDVEKMVIFFLISVLKKALSEENANEMISVYDYESVVV